MNGILLNKYRFILNRIFFILSLILYNSCLPDYLFDQNAEVNLEITLPENNELKSAASLTKINSVTLTVSSGNKILAEKELIISENNTASGTVSIQTGNNIKFSAAARDENDIIQWQGSTTANITKNFSVDIRLEAVPPSKSSLQASFDVEERFIHLSWTQNSDPDFAKYELYRSDSEKTPGIKIYSTNDISEIQFDDISVSERTTYFYTLIVFDTAGSGTESNVVQVDFPNIPPVASFLSSSAIGRVVYLSWTQSNDPEFDRYELFRSDTKIYSSYDKTKTTYTDQILSEGEYVYILYVIDKAGYKAESNSVKLNFIF